jgi:hypothetical protein
MDYISDTIEASRYKFNPKLTQVCIELIKQLNENPPPDKKCWRFMQILFMINKATPMNLPYYWFLDGIVVDPEALTMVTGGIIQFKWDDECPGCQIEDSCSCSGNPHRSD